MTQAREALANAGLSGEVVVVDNGSKDGSPEVAAAAGARVIREARRGYGRALRTGFENARGDVVVMADADGTYDLAKIPAITRPVIDGEADMVLATRLDGATSETMPFLHRYVGTPVITFLTSRASGRRVTKDSQTGYRAFRRDGVLKLGLTGNGMELASEMLIKAGRAGYRIENIPGGYSPRIGDSKLDTWSDGWRHLKLILLLAPDLVLIGPGLMLAVLGLVALVLGFAQPAGVEVGSARWQPVFFSGIALVLGCQVFFAGAVVANNSPLSLSAQTRFKFLRAPDVGAEVARTRAPPRVRRAPDRRRTLRLMGAGHRRRTDDRLALRVRFAGADAADPRRFARRVRRGGQIPTACCRCVDPLVNCRNRPIRPLTPGGPRS